MSDAKNSEAIEPQEGGAVEVKADEIQPEQELPAGETQTQDGTPL